MKLSFILLVIFCFMLSNAYTQFTCNVITSGLKSGGVILNYQDYIPNSSTPVKLIRINFHFMLHEDPSSPGNFTSYDDGRGDTTFTGYDFINDLLFWTNARLNGNSQMLYPLGNTTPVIQRKYLFVVNGVFFHKDDSKYIFGTNPYLTYSENIGNAINVFFQSDGTTENGGHANLALDRFVEFKGRWDTYNSCKNSNIGWGNWANAAGLMHESGHNLSLLHTVMNNSGSCCDYCDDYCTDTPTRSFVILNNGVDPCQTAQFGNPINSNNIMDYSGSDAITPEQLGRIHWTIQNEIQSYQPCYYTINSLNILNFTDNKSYIAETITIPSESNILVDNHKALYINSNLVTINGSFEIKLGAQLVINPVPKCN